MDKEEIENITNMLDDITFELEKTVWRLNSILRQLYQLRNQLNPFSD